MTVEQLAAMVDAILALSPADRDILWQIMKESDICTGCGAVGPGTCWTCTDSYGGARGDYVPGED